jgi:chemotaxis protein MotA
MAKFPLKPLHWTTVKGLGFDWRHHMDIATIVGLIIGFAGVIGGFLLEGGLISALISETAFLIVVGGTIGATVISFSFEELKRVPAFIKEAFVEQQYDLQGLIQEMVSLANRARREGLLSLEQKLKDVDDAFLRRGLQLVVDGVESSRLRDMLETEIYCSNQRAKTGVEIFETAGGYAPTMGIIGTVMGLVNVLGNMTNPDELGPMIAVAFIATLYGIGTANLLWLPLAAKLKVRNKKKLLYKELALEGIMSLQAGEASSLMREKLLAFVDDEERKLMEEEENRL